MKGKKTSLPEHARADERRPHGHRKQCWAAFLALKASANSVHPEGEGDGIEARIDKSLALDRFRI